MFGGQDNHAEVRSLKSFNGTHYMYTTSGEKHVTKLRNIFNDRIQDRIFCIVLDEFN